MSKLLCQRKPSTCWIWDLCIHRRKTNNKSSEPPVSFPIYTQRLLQRLRSPQIVNLYGPALHAVISYSPRFKPHKPHKLHTAHDGKLRRAKGAFKGPSDNTSKQTNPHSQLKCQGVVDFAYVQFAVPTSAKVELCAHVLLALAQQLCMQDFTSLCESLSKFSPLEFRPARGNRCRLINQLGHNGHLMLCDSSTRLRHCLSMLNSFAGVTKEGVAPRLILCVI